MEKKNNKASFAEVRPNLVEEWDFEKNGDLHPEQVTAFSNRKVWWKCPRCGQSWLASIVSRTRGCGCPYDAGRLPVTGKNDLATLYPDVVEEWDFEKNGDLRPEQVTASSNRKVWWKCSCCSHSVQMTISNRVRRKVCPICKKNQAE